MATDPLEQLLADDHRDLARSLDDRAVLGPVVRRMRRRAYAKALGVGAAGLAGMAIALAQLPALRDLSLPAADNVLNRSAFLAGALFIGLMVTAVAFCLPDVD